jgi:hypothetical protein
MAKRKRQGPENSAKQPLGKRGGARSGLIKVLLIAIAVFVIGIALIARFGGEIVEKYSPAPTPRTKAIEKGEREVSVFFADPDGETLKSLKLRVRRSTIENEIKEALDLLATGPPANDLSPTIPDGARVKSVSIKDSVAYVDFTSRLTEGHGGGSAGELITVYSIVDTATFSFPEINAVQILVEGKTVETIAGHIDVSSPLESDIKRSRPDA